jgi:hypothetical protein
MRMHVVGLVVSGLLTVSAIAGCSDSSGGDPDVLAGVGDSTASALCEEFSVTRSALETARQTIDPAGISRATADYRSLAATARDDGAKEFAKTVSKAADAAEVLSKDLTSATKTDFSVLMAQVFRIQLYDTTVQLACAEHGHV